MTIELSRHIRAETDDRFFGSRLFSSISSYAKEKGCIKGCVMGTSTVAATIFVSSVSYFLMEGSVRAIIDTINDKGNDPVRIRPLGDTGGWISLAMFSLLGLGSLSVQFVREGEYYRLKSLCKNWIRDNRAVIVEDPETYKNLYMHVNDLLDAFQSQCLFAKSLASRRITALEVFHELEPDQGKYYRRDLKMQNLLQEIHADMDNVTSSKLYFQRVYDGQQSLKTMGYSKQYGTLILGVALPIIFLLNAILSVVGEVGLGKELFVDREELTDVGHFGEWPLNAFEAIAMAFFLHLVCMVNEGDFVRIRRVYERHIEALAGSHSRHNRLVDIANQELMELSSGIHNFKLPMEYQFKKI